MLGPVTTLPETMIRPNVLLCCGEDPDEWAAALLAAGATPTAWHAYRGVHAWASDEGMTLLAPWGSAAVDAVLHELLGAPGIERLILWGTAGSLPACTAKPMVPYAVAQAKAHATFLPDGTQGEPTMGHDLPTVQAVTTDAFYGISPTDPHPCWEHVRHEDAIVDMESATFYHIADRLAPHVQRLAIRVVANPVDDLDALPASSAEALAIALDAALACFDQS